jgi:hypothetical protein
MKGSPNKCDAGNGAVALSFHTDGLCAPCVTTGVGVVMGVH